MSEPAEAKTQISLSKAAAALAAVPALSSTLLRIHTTSAAARPLPPRPPNRFLSYRRHPPQTCPP